MSLYDFLHEQLVGRATPGYVTAIAVGLVLWISAMIAMVWFIHKAGWHNDPVLRAYSDEEQMKALTRYRNDKIAKQTIKDAPDADDWDFEKGTIRDER